MEPIIITPKTNIHDLLEAYPELDNNSSQVFRDFKAYYNAYSVRCVKDE